LKRLVDWLQVSPDGTLTLNSHAASADPRMRLASTRTLAVVLRLMLLEGTAPGLPLGERRRSALRGVPRGQRKDVLEWAEGCLEAAGTRP
jgi:hypothetical protein